MAQPLMSLEEYSKLHDPKTYKSYLEVNGGNRGFDWRTAAPVVGMAALPFLPMLGGALGGGSAAAGTAGASGAAGAAGTAGAAAGGSGGMGLLSTIQQIASLGQIASGAAQGSANQRSAENNQAAQRNALLASLYNTNQNATMNALTSASNERTSQRGQALDEKKFALTAPSTRASQSVRGSIMQNAQPVTLSGLSDKIHVPTISGGLSPALFNADTRALGGEMTRKALIDQLKGDDFAPMEKTDFSGGVLPTPKLEDYQNKPGMLEKILGTLGLGGSLAGGVGEAFGAGAFGAKGRQYEPNDQNGWG